MFCTGQPWKRANTETLLSTTLTSLQWSVSHLNILLTYTSKDFDLWLTKLLLFICLTLNGHIALFSIVFRYHLSVDVLAQLQLSHYKIWGSPAQNCHEHLLLSGFLHTGDIRFLFPTQPWWQIGHGEHPLVVLLWNYFKTLCTVWRTGFHFPKPLLAHLRDRVYNLQLNPWPCCTSIVTGTFPFFALMLYKMLQLNLVMCFSGAHPECCSGRWCGCWNSWRDDADSSWLHDRGIPGWNYFSSGIQIPHG